MVLRVATVDEIEALEKRIRSLEARADRTGSEWMRLRESPLGARKLRRLIASGKLQASRIGRLLLVRVQDHDKLLEQHVSKPKQPKPKIVQTRDPAKYVLANPI